MDPRTARLGARRTMAAGALVLGVLTLPGLIGSASPAGGAPARGTVKVDGVPFENPPGNEPHVGCAFGIDLYGYEADLPVSITFTLQPPTGHGQLVVVDTATDGDDASGGGSEAGHDGHVDVDLTDALAGVDLHPQQGWHVRLTVEVDGHAKHKTYWVSGCDGSTTTTTTSTTTTTTEPEETTTTTEPEETTTTNPDV